MRNARQIRDPPEIARRQLRETFDNGGHRLDTHDVRLLFTISRAVPLSDWQPCISPNSRAMFNETCRSIKCYVLRGGLRGPAWPRRAAAADAVLVAVRRLTRPSLAEEPSCGAATCRSSTCRYTTSHVVLLCDPSCSCSCSCSLCQRAPNDPGEDGGPSAVLLTWCLCPGAATDLRRQLAGPVGSTTCLSLV